MEALRRPDEEPKVSETREESELPVEPALQDSEQDPTGVRLRGVVPKDTVPHTGTL